MFEQKDQLISELEKLSDKPTESAQIQKESSP